MTAKTSGRRLTGCPYRSRLVPSLLFQVRSGNLIPGDTDTRQAMSRYEENQFVRVSEPKRLRNPRQHRLYWALVGEMQGYAQVKCSRDDLSDWIKIAVGHCEEVTYPDGTKAVRPKSIAFGNLSQEAWEAFFESVLDFVCQKIIPGTKSADLRAHLEEMIG